VHAPQDGDPAKAVASPPKAGRTADDPKFGSAKWLAPDTMNDSASDIPPNSGP
jgi:hypothetical protein